jgi:hypothetical protein
VKGVYKFALNLFDLFRKVKTILFCAPANYDRSRRTSAQAKLYGPVTQKASRASWLLVATDGEIVFGGRRVLKLEAKLTSPSFGARTSALRSARRERAPIPAWRLDKFLPSWM